MKFTFAGTWSWYSTCSTPSKSWSQDKGTTTTNGRRNVKGSFPHHFLLVVVVVVVVVGVGGVEADEEAYRENPRKDRGASSVVVGIGVR
jgi:hypothetical protein